MVIKSLNLFWQKGGYGNNSSSATIQVDGLGEVTIKNCISDELRERLEEEALLSLRIKLGQVVEVNNEEKIKTV